MQADVSKRGCFRLTIGLIFLAAVSVLGQESFDVADVPSRFRLDLETAARLRSGLMAESSAPAGRYAVGSLVFGRLVGQIPASSSIRFAWQLRIVDDGEFNAYSSPDGTVYVESGLAQLADSGSGLWAAILSHEIAHVVRRDWARRYLFQKSVENGGGVAIVLGDPGLPSASWTDSQMAAQNLGGFCRRLEVEADRAGLMLMVGAGYHPDFVPALHHLLHAKGSGPAPASLAAMHPCWEERDRELSRAYAAASIEFGHRWPEWYASPGGNPPIVVFAEEPTVRKTSAKEWEIQLPIHCQNLAGAVEVVLRAGYRNGGSHFERPPEQAAAGSEIRQLTGCTSPRTTVTFTLANPSGRPEGGVAWTDVYVLDAWGSVLARADVPKLPR